MPRALFLVALASVLLVWTGSAQQDPSSTRYLARAGNVFITEGEFLQRFEMLPSLYRHRKPKLPEAKLQLIYSMVAEKLLAQEAEERRLDQDSLFRESLTSIRKLLGRDELYRQEVADKAVPTDEEIERGMREARVQLLVAYLFFAKKEDADFVRSRISSPSDFDRMKIDSSMDALRDTATIIWGDAEPAIERAAYALTSTAISPVVPAGDGSYILRLQKRQPNSYYALMPGDVFRERVAKKLRTAKERELLAEVLPDLLSGRPGYARPVPFREIAKALQATFRAQAADSLTFLSADMAADVRNRCNAILGDTAVVAGTTVWSVSDVIGLLYSRQFRVPRDDIGRIPSLLNLVLEEAVQQEVLGQEAIDRGLDTLPPVRQQIDMWRQADLAAAMKRYVRQQTSVTDAEVWEYLRSQHADVPVAAVQIRELRTSTVDEMRRALADLDEGMSFPEVVGKWSIDPAARASGGITPPFPVTERSPLGELASQMDPGQRYGPVHTPEGEVYFELVAKTVQRLDSSEAARFSRARDELLGMKAKRTLNLLLAKAGKDRGVTVYTDRLQQLEVTPIPMLTYRILGFGGRMFAVPFVDIQTEWTGVKPPDTDVLP